MSDELRQLEERLRSAMALNFDLLEQGINMVRTQTATRLEQQEERMRAALAAQRNIIEDSFSSLEAVVKDARQRFEASAGDVTRWMHHMEERVEALEKRTPPAA
jgi:hypothetical protein